MSQQQLYTSLFGPISNEDPVDKLNEIIEKYPYYATAHYFLLQHTSKESPDHSQIAGRTALHFNNPYYLQYLLNNDHGDGLKATSKENPPSKETAGNIEQVSSQTTATEQPIKRQEEQELVFEPLHTTDYFASQGIKLSDEVKPDDKLGKQLRSFTDWLKTMKKVHEQRLPAGNAALDMTVQTIAEKSNQEEEVITESMADVYKEQGKAGKAREIYQKLSLLDPSKSAYFAAKIDSLKDL